MDLRGWLEMIFQSRCQREPVRYQWGAYDSMYKEWMHSINLGGTAEVYYGFCPCMGQKPFFMLALRHACKIRYTAMGSLLTDSCISNFTHMAKAMTEMKRSGIEVACRSESHDRCLDT